MTTENLQTDSGETRLLTLRSTLRVGDVGEFKTECDALLEESPQAPLACDASAVEFIDAAALQYMVALSLRCAGAARGFEIRSPSAAFTSAAKVSGYATPLGLAAA